jgi:N-acetylglutamate synthase-like GNAT family acetyltransferase
VDEAGAMVGCGQIKRHGDGSRELASIAVVPEMRGRGLARCIIERLLAESEGPLYLTCRASLGPFYEKFGFYRLDWSGPLPPFFHRLSRLMKIMNSLHVIPAEGLLIMRRD